MMANHGRDFLMFETQARAGEGRCTVLAKLTVTPDGAIMQVLGGEKPHVGAVALALPYPSQADPDRVSASTTIVPRPAHKDDRVAGPLAEWLAISLRAPAVVVVGLHVQEAGREEIDKLVAAAWEAAREAWEQYRCRQR